MDFKALFMICGTVFLAELADKTQLATILFASRNPSKLTVFLGSSLGLVLACALGVLAGTFVEHFLNPKIVTKTAGILFILIGLITFIKG